ncbi:hypothetical protein [Pollutimonas nitritireducens]|nr:hypothetical protein [Pollutimonas nitritireducens]
MQRMIAAANADLVAQQDWINDHRNKITTALGQLHADFAKLRSAK